MFSLQNWWPFSQYTMGNSINVHDFLKCFSSWSHLSSVYKYVIVNLHLLFVAMNPNTVHFDKRFLHKNWFFPLLCNVWCLNQNGCNWSHFPLGVMWPDIKWPWRLLHERPFTREGNYLFFVAWKFRTKFYDSLQQKIVDLEISLPRFIGQSLSLNITFSVCRES